MVWEATMKLRQKKMKKEKLAKSFLAAKTFSTVTNDCFSLLLMQSKSSLIYIKKQLNLFHSQLLLLHLTPPLPHGSYTSTLLTLQGTLGSEKINISFSIPTRERIYYSNLMFLLVSTFVLPDAGRPQPQVCSITVEAIRVMFNLHARNHFQVRWLINGMQVDDQYEHNSGDVIENRLLWPSVQRSDLNSIFTCQADNTKLVEAKETSFVLDMNCELEIEIFSSLLLLFACLCCANVDGWIVVC